MFRLMAMTFLGTYRGPAWDAGHHGQQHAHSDAPAADAHAGHGHGHWHGPHESPAPMTLPLQALAVGAVVAGLVGIPAALGGGNAIEHFLEPSFTAREVATSGPEGRGAALPPSETSASREASESHEPTEVSRSTELGLMAFSVVIAVIGIALARKFYVASPQISDRLATRWAGAHRLLSNKYYVDELYNSTVISGTFGLGRGLWIVDRNVVDGAVNGSGWITIIGAWISGLADRTIVDGLVNLVGRICEEGSFWFRKLQTGLVQNYALLMLFGVFAFMTIYLFMR
jgi:NADH-quinone oxidoreductase subunit L